MKILSDLDVCPVKMSLYDKFNIPETVTILTNEWKVEFFDEEEFRGKCDVEQQKIYINKNMHPEVMRKTLIHEMVHAYIDCLYLEFDSEAKAEKIGNICYFLICDNIKLMEK